MKTRYLNINGESIATSNITINQLQTLFEEFYNINKKYPMAIQCNRAGQLDFNLPSWNIITKILKSNNISLNNFNNSLNNKTKNIADVKDYEKYIEILKDLTTSLGRSIKYYELLHNTYDLPTGNWFVKYCPDKSVKSFPNFIEWVGLYKAHSNISKEKTIELILIKAKELNRPLKQTDFIGINQDEIGINVINRIWGNFNNMKNELNLEIIQENMLIRVKSYEALKNDLKILCEEIYHDEKRKTITTKDINNSKNTLDINTYRKYFKINNTTLREYLLEIGFSLQNEGNGLNHTFEDGEKTVSQYELEFSKLLRNKLNFVYNKDYVRDIKYKDFIFNYNGMLNCDYKIKYNNRTIYIEVAGMLRDGKDNFKNNTPIINSKSKEKYRQKLMLKEKMLKDNNLEYYILFPSDLKSEDFLLSIFKK